jgi:hypothetical protein
VLDDRIIELSGKHVASRLPNENDFKTHHHHIEDITKTTAMPHLPALRVLTRSLRRAPVTAPPIPAMRLSSSFQPQPSPPKLPAEQQAEFERLQRAAAVSAAFQVPDADESAAVAAAENTAATKTTTQVDADTSDGGDLNQGLFRGAPPEFEGEQNPKTGEVGGPKNEPLRWGGDGDWSYNGRVTDF